MLHEVITHIKQDGWVLITSDDGSYVVESLITGQHQELTRAEGNWLQAIFKGKLKAFDERMILGIRMCYWAIPEGLR